MAIWVAAVLGIVQGVFMFFPVSSTSHLALTQHWLISRGEELPPPESPEMILFDLVVHVGTLVSIAVVFRKSLSVFLERAFNGFKELLSEEQTPMGMLYVKLTALGLLSVLVTGMIGLPLKSLFESVFANPYAISFTLLITGVLLWWTDVLPARKVGLRDIGIRIAIIIGIAQGLALLPGISRSGMTIAFALFAGMKRRWAAEYSFFIAFPTILGASLLQSIEIFRLGGWEALDFPVFFVVFFVSAIVGIIALYLVLTLLYRAKFRFFSYYVWALAVFVAANAYLGLL